MNTYVCPHCKIEVKTREHMCIATRAIGGKAVNSLVVYQPNYPKPNKQSTQPGYMKTFGSRAVKVQS
jgi:hypothetical protein